VNSSGREPNQHSSATGMSSPRVDIAHLNEHRRADPERVDVVVRAVTIEWMPPLSRLTGVGHHDGPVVAGCGRVAVSMSCLTRLTRRPSEGLSR
jgi:hypothetical protein